MPTKIVNTNNGTDFSSCKPVILCNADGYVIDAVGVSTGIKVVDTKNGTDFSALKKIIITDINGNSIS